MGKGKILVSLFLAIAPLAASEASALPRRPMAGLMQPGPRMAPLARLRALRERIQARRAERAAARAARDAAQVN